jgi:hypothetical protein
MKKAVMKKAVRCLFSLISAAIIASAMAKAAPRPPDQDEEPITVVSIDWKITDPGTEGASVAWIVVVRNDTDHQRQIMGNLQLLDQDGFVVDGDLFGNVLLDAGESRTFRGLTPVGADEADKIVDAKAVMQSFVPATGD